MDINIVSFPVKSLEKCSSCGCSCSLNVNSLSNGVWIRSVKRKYDEFERSGRFYIPGLDILPVARVGIENECALLRETVSSQQATIQDLCLELEEERNASSSAANEAMSMILRLQREKADIQMEARQFKRYAEEKMSHDSQEIASLDDVLYKREQAIQSLTCEVQAYKHRMMSFGLTESEAEGLRGTYSGNASLQGDMVDLVEFPAYSYPPLRCSSNALQGPPEFEDDVEKYPFEETPRSQDLKKLEQRINQLERTPRGDQLNMDFGSRNVLEKVIVGHSDTPSSLGYNRDMGPDCVDSQMWGTTTSFKKLDCVAEEQRKSKGGSDYEDDVSDRVYTIDSVHPGASYNNVPEPKAATNFCDEHVSTPRGMMGHYDTSDRDVKKLYLRLQALEADRESMRQTIISMQTDKAQLVLLREIAQQLCKDMSPAKSMPLQKASIVKSFSFLTVFKWILSFVFWKKKARRSKYMFDLTAKNPGLLLLLDKNPSKFWRCASSTQV